MVRTLGVDHGTQSIRFCLLEDENRSFFEIDRKRASKGAVLNLLEKKDFLPVELIGMTYSMADAINNITNINQTHNRGQLKAVTGKLVGGGTALFDALQGSGLRTVLIPGLHRGIDCLDDRFKLLYSHMASSEKVAIGYHAFLEVNKSIDTGDILITDISSNTVTIGVKDGKFFGAFDACIGAPGLLHGPLDLENIRKIDSGKTTANKAFYSAGVSQKSRQTTSDILLAKTPAQKLALNSLIMAVTMEVEGFSSIINSRAVAIAGSVGIDKLAYGILKSELKHIGPVLKLDNFAAAIGAAEIARDMLQGRKDFLGIGVNL
jgi:putative methanogenesis marker protein 12